MPLWGFDFHLHATRYFCSIKPSILNSFIGFLPLALRLIAAAASAAGSFFVAILVANQRNNRRGNKTNIHDWLPSSNHFVLHIIVLHLQTYCFTNIVPNAQKTASMVEYCTWKIPVFWVCPTRGWTTLWGCGLEMPWCAVEKMKVIAAKQCNLFCTWCIGMWTKWTNFP